MSSNGPVVKELQKKDSRIGARALSRWRRQWISFLVGLGRRSAQDLLSGEQPGDLLNVCAGMVRGGLMWLLDGAPAQGAEHFAQLFRANPKSLETLLTELRRLLDAVADGGTYELAIEPDSKIVLDAGALKAGDLKRGSTMHHPSNEKGMVQCVLFAAQRLLSNDEAAMVRRCDREPCKRVFQAARPKQRFCSHQCASAASFENHKRQIGEEAYRVKHREAVKRSYDHYHKKIRKNRKEKNDGAQKRG
jgi:hypothetical protein